ncbi:type II secretion system protein [bacterium]|nr:type II secretion system protein [bacterium]
MKRQKIKGFTLLEVIITLSILGILALISVLTLYSCFRGNLLDETSQKIVFYLELAREKSIAQNQGKNWGVYFENPSGTDNSFFSLFYGDNYSSDNSVEKIYLPKKVEFSDPADNSSKEVVFRKITGFLKGGSDNSVTIYLKENPSQTKTIDVNLKGLVSN